MGKSALPRELELLINQVAHEHSPRAYRLEKTRVLEQVVAWLSEGATLDTVMNALNGRLQRKRGAKHDGIRAVVESIVSEIRRTR